MLLPCTVTDAAPVPGPFDRRSRLSPLPSADHAWLVLPACDSTVITKRRLSPDPCPTLHLTDVSDSQLVPSHPVCPVRPSAVSRTIPIPAPCTVTDAEPVPARFTRRVQLIASTSKDHAWLTLPMPWPTVITTPRVPCDPCAALHLTDVSDPQPVASHPVQDKRALLDSRAKARPEPCTVTDAAPVNAPLPLRVRLMASMSADQAWLKLPLRDPTVITTRRVPKAPRLTRHLTDVSDSQLVPSHPVCPVRPLAVCCSLRNPAPCTVTDAEPVPARLELRRTLTALMSADQAWLMLPDRDPAVMTVRLDPWCPRAARHLTDVSDSQLVPSHPVCPVRLLAV